MAMLNFTRFKAVFSVVLLYVLSLSNGVSAQVQTARNETMIGNSKGFYEYLPQNYYSESQSYPLLIFIHGVGELGNGGSDLYLVSQVGTPKLINQGGFPTSFNVNGQKLLDEKKFIWSVSPL